MSRRSRFVCLMLAGSAALFAGAPASLAQDYGAYGPPPGYDAGPPPEEGVIVVAPRIRENGSTQRSFDLPPSSVSLSVPVSYSDLDLRTRRGAHELRRRVREAAQGVCGQLANAYPFYQLHLTNCLHDATDTALAKAGIEINNARVEAREVRYYGYSD